MTDADDYFPSIPELQELWQKLSNKARLSRFQAALQREARVKEFLGRTEDLSERNAVTQMPGSDRTNLRRWSTRYKEFGFDGLLFLKTGVGPASMPAEIRTVVCTLRRSDPGVPVEVIVEHLRNHHRYITSVWTIRRVLKAEGLARRPGPGKSTSSAVQTPLQFGGAKLLEVAIEEIGIIKKMAASVRAQLDDAVVGELPEPVDTSGRDEYGRFLSSYNECYRKGVGDPIGPGFLSIDMKTDGLNLARLHIYGATQEVIERKLLALMFSNLLGNGRWDGLRQARGELLGELCGYAYMPSTLELFAGELKYARVSSTLWEVHARQWLQVTEAWGTERQAAVLFVDGTSKPLWTGLFCQASKVSSVGRVIPALETVSFHSGYGVPVWFVTGSGRIPLVEAVPKLLTDFAKVHGNDEIGKIIVIDAEGNSVRFLKGLEQGEPRRGWVTRLKPSLVRGKEIEFTTDYAPYGHGDEIREGFVHLNDPDKRGEVFRCRIAEIRRHTRGTFTYIGASTLLDVGKWSGNQFTELYFERWPNQELNFRAVNQALDIKQVHGYGKQLVDNVVVVRELDELTGTIAKHESTIAARTAQLEEQQEQLEKHRAGLRSSQARVRSITKELQRSAKKGGMSAEDLSKLADEQKALMDVERKLTQSIAREEKNVQKLSTQRELESSLLTRQKKRKEALESRRQILKMDVELDMLFSVLKCSLVLVVQYVLREYFKGTRMDAITFLNRFATLPARLRALPDREILTFSYNQRNPDIMALLLAHCETINARALRTRSGRTLEVRVDPAPPPRLPPPGPGQMQSPISLSVAGTHERVLSNDRTFHLTVRT